MRQWPDTVSSSLCVSCIGILHRLVIRALRLMVVPMALSLLYAADSNCAPAKQITVVLRYDDCSAHSPSDLEARLIAALQKNRVHCTFAVIPYVYSGKPSPQSSHPVEPLTQGKARMLLTGIRSGVLEVAQHGYSHEPTYSRPDGRLSELEGLPYTRQIQRLARGRRLLESRLGMRITTFVPPWDSYDASTLRALGTLGFAAISPGMHSVPDRRTALRFLPDTCLLPDLEAAIIAARASLDRQPVVVALLHPQDMKELDATKGMYSLEQCEQVLAWLGTRPDVRTSTVGEATQLVDVLDRDRLARCSRFLASPASRLLPSSMPILYYPSDSDLARMASCMWMRVAVFYVVLFLMSGILGFLLVELAATRLRTTRPAIGYGVSVPAVLISVLALRRDVMQFGEIVGFTSALGLWAGAWVRLRRGVSLGIGEAPAVLREVNAPSPDPHPSAVRSGRVSGRRKRAGQSRTAHVRDRASAADIGRKSIGWIMLLTIAFLPITAWPAAKDPNVAKLVLLALGLTAMCTVSMVTGAVPWRMRRDPLGLAVLSYTGIVCVSWLYSEYRYATLRMVTVVLPYTVLYYAVRGIAADRVYRERVILSLLCSGCIVSAIGILEQTHVLRWGDPWSIGSTWFNRTYLAAYLLAILPLGLWAASRGNSALRRIGLLTLLLGLPSLVFTGARAAWLAPAPAIVLGCLGMMRAASSRKRRLVCCTVLVLVVGVLILQLASDCIAPGFSPVTMSSLIGTGHDWSNRGRVAYMSAALAMGRMHPMIGFGAGTYSMVGAGYLAPTSMYAHGEPVTGHAHNEFLQIFGELGIIGLLTFISMPIVAGWLTYRQLRKPPVYDGENTLALALLTGMAAFLAANLVGISGRVPGELGFVYIYAGLIGAAYPPEEKASIPMDRGKGSLLGRLAMGVLSVILAVMALCHVNSARASTLLLHGETLLKAASGNAEWAIPSFREACRLAGPSPEAQYDLANAYAMAGMWDNALETYDVVERLSPNYARVHFNQGTVLLYTRQYRKALAEFEEAYRRDARADTLMRLNYARARLKGGGTPES